MNSYKVNSISSHKESNLSSLPWQESNVLCDFTSPWENVSIDKIEFRALHDTSHFYFKFKVYDSKLHIVSDDDSNDSINNSDRVELFFRSDSLMQPYYCLEIDPTPRVMDFKALPNKEFDFDWNWPKGEINVESSVEAEYFEVQGTISLKSLEDFNLLKEGKIEAGIYRAKYNQKEDLSFEPLWITWVDPNTEEPNFHIASSFGVLELI